MRFGNGVTSSRKTYRYWTPAEVDKLLELVGDLPFPLAVGQWNIWAAKQGLGHRSINSIRKKASDLGETACAYGRWMHLMDVARMLGRHRSTLNDWIHRGVLTVYRYGPRTTLRRMDLVKLAKERPWLFGGCDRSGLIQLLEDEALVNDLLKRYPRQSGIGRKVRCGSRVFNSYADASRALHISVGAIRWSLKTGKPTCGMTFEQL